MEFEKIILVPIGALIIALSGYIAWFTTKFLKMGESGFLIGIITAIIGIALIVYGEDRYKILIRLFRKGRTT